MNLIKLLTAPLCLLLLVQIKAKSQNVFNPLDTIANFNEAAVLGTPAKPFVPPTNVMAKWGRIRNSGRIPWGASDFKAYIWNGMQFRLKYPINYNPANASKYPVIVFMHGLGEARTSDYENEDQLYWGAQDFRNRMNEGLWNGFLLFPQISGTWDNNAFPEINRILDTLGKYCNLDNDRVITMGLSSGGYGSIEYALLYPQRAASVISSTPRSTNNYNNSYVHVPINLSNGGQDAAPNPYQIKSFVTDFRNAGGDIYHSYYVDNGHDTWTKQWNQRDLNNNYTIVKAWNAAHKAQPLVFYGKDEFCAGSPISAKIGISAGYNAYEWQRDIGGGFTAIAGATSNEYTATVAGLYRVRFRRTASGPWSEWTPSPVNIKVKTCSVDTAFAEHFDNEPTLYYSAAPAYINYSFTPCQNGVMSNATDGFVADALGRYKSRFMSNWTRDGAGCALAVNDKVWGNINGVPVTPNSYYTFTFFLANQSNAPLAAIIPNVNGTILTEQVSAGTVGVWRKLSYRWFSGNDNMAYMELRNQNGAFSGNNFSIDEISLVKLPYSPGGVVDDLKLWVKAEGTPDAKIPTLRNYAGNTDLIQPTVSRQPVFENNAADNINFNPVISFPGSGTNQLLAEQGFSRLGTHHGVHTFTVLAPNNTIAQTASFLRETNATPVGESNGMVNIFLPTTTNISFEAGSATLINRVTTPYVPAEIGIPRLFSFSKDVTNNTPNGNKQDIRKNGVLTASIATGTTFTGDRSNFTLGSDGTNTLNARVAEVIYMLDGVLSASEQGRIESYLALKYGISLGTPASPVNYLATDGVIYWNGNATYQNDVFGIGRDDVTLLSQLQSNSVNSGSGDGTGQTAKGNTVLSVASLTNKQFLVIGHDNGSLVETTIIAGQAPAVVVGSRRLPRNWKVRNTGGVGAVNLSIDRTGLVFTGGNITNNYRLMIDNDGDGNYNTGSLTYVAPTSVTATKVSFTGVTLPNNAVYTLITLLVSGGALPVDLSDFKVMKLGEKASLSWTTTAEVNNKHFEVEHSVDGLNWVKIGIVNGMGNSNSARNYSFVHSVPAKGINYYRLKQVDIDDKSKVSAVRSVIFGKSAQLIIYPNPTKGRVVIQSGEVLRSISVFSMSGQRLIQEQPTGATSGTVYEINVSSLARGIYILQLIDVDGTVKNIKLEKE